MSPAGTALWRRCRAELARPLLLALLLVSATTPGRAQAEIASESPGSTPTTASRNPCAAALAGPSVSVGLVATAVELDESRARAQFHGSFGGRKLPRLMGYTEATLGVKAHLSWRLHELVDGRLCARRHATLELRLTAHRVYLPKELSAEPCLRGQLLAHEHQHVLRNERALAETGAELLALAQREFAQQVFQGRAHTVRNWLATQPADTFDWRQRALSIFKDKALALHHALDDASEYRRLGAVCNGAALELLREVRPLLID